MNSGSGEYAIGIQLPEFINQQREYDLKIYDIIYAIVLKEDLDYTKDPLSIKRYYIGRAEPQRFNNRKSEHRRNMLTDNGDMYQALSDLERDYDTTIEFIILEEVYTTTHSREWYWIEQSLQDNHPLLNTKPGDIDRTTSGAYATTSKPTERNVEVFENAEWVKGAPRANKGEWSTHLFGAQFYKRCVKFIW